MTATAARVLLVDDEPHVLDALRRMLRDQFQVDTAADPALALERIRDSDPYAVIMSDFQMPRMDGAHFLAAAREICPDSSRILLTGQADLTGAASVVNQGGILRLLLKPAKREEITASLAAGVRAYRSISAERELLDTTLRGSIRALTEVLALANPVAFARSTRLRNLVAALMAAAGQELSWHIDVAVMLADLGVIALPPEVLERMDRGKSFSADEQELVNQLPTVADKILTGIPRIEEVREVILYEASQHGRSSDADDDSGGPVGARVLRVARDFDLLLSRDADAVSALATMRSARRRYDPTFLDALAVVVAGEQGREPRALGVANLRPGMVVTEDVYSNNGLKLVTKGSHLTSSLIARLENFAAMESGVAEPLHVFIGTVGLGTL